MRLIVFLCGAATMMLEMTGSRILAPYFGTSIYVWTNLIGVVLAFLSAGYWLGGILCDKAPSQKKLGVIIAVGATHVSVLVIFSDLICVLTQSVMGDIRFGSLIASLFLFAIPSLMLGAVAPYAAKLSLSNLNQSGKTIGNLYALSTFGSIAGTFSAGLYLLSMFSHVVVLGIVALILWLSALLCGLMKRISAKIALIVFLSMIALSARALALEIARSGLYDIPTLYSRLWIYKTPRWPGDAPVLMMQINNETSSLRFTDSNELAAEYTKYYRLCEHFVPKLKNALMIGGAGYSYPQDFLNKFPDASMDVVEIDPGVTQAARDYFSLKHNTRLHIYHEDARTYVQKSEKKYDVIFGDAFKSCSVPFHLTTLEFLQSVRQKLNPGGAYMMNVISSVQGRDGRYLRAQIRTLRKVFDQVYVFCVENPEDGLMTQNLMVVALSTDKKPKFYSKNMTLNDQLSHLWIKPIAEDEPVLTDHFAPVDKYSLDLFKLITKTNTPMRRTFQDLAQKLTKHTQS